MASFVLLNRYRISLTNWHRRFSNPATTAFQILFLHPHQKGLSPLRFKMLQNATTSLERRSLECWKRLDGKWKEIKYLLSLRGIKMFVMIQDNLFCILSPLLSIFQCKSDPKAAISVSTCLLSALHSLY